MNTDGSKAAQHTILVVDDELVARKVLSNLLERRGYRVVGASSADEALAMMESTHPDMVIADIHMEGMDGVTLLGLVRERYPGVRRVLMTGYSIDEHVALARQYDIGNVLAKGSGFQYDEISEYAARLLSGDIFGLERYFQNAQIRSTCVHTQQETRNACASVVAKLRPRDPLFLEMAIDELISNAVFHGVLRGKPRSEWNDAYRLDDRECVTVSWASDDRKVGVSVVDPEGRLRKSDVLRWLENPLGEREVGEEHGRGLVLVRKLVDRLIINIRSNTMTECIILQFRSPEMVTGEKPLMVYEV